MHNLLWIGVAILLCFKVSPTNCQSFELNHSVYKPELEEECDNKKNVTPFYQEAYDKFSCFMVWSYLTTFANDSCTNFWYNNKRYDIIGMKGPMQRALVQYCKGTNFSTECFKCFNDAVDHIWFQNPNGTTVSDQGFRCEDFLKGGYLSRYYHEVTKFVIIPADDVVVKAYRTVREDMCNLTINKTECVTCYTEGDNKFMFYLKNNNTEIKSVVENFTDIHTIYEKCHNQSYVPESYKKMLSKPHDGLAEFNITNTHKCGVTFEYSFMDLQKSKSFCETNKENKTSSYKDYFDVVLDVMSFNLFSHLGYGLGHQHSENCSLDAYQHLFCMMRVGDFFSERLRDNLTETEADDAMNQFTSMLSEGCSYAYNNN